MKTLFRTLAGSLLALSIIAVAPTAATQAQACGGYWCNHYHGCHSHHSCWGHSHHHHHSHCHSHCWHSCHW